jgi:hypothetical protein
LKAVDVTDYLELLDVREQLALELELEPAQLVGLVLGVFAHELQPLATEHAPVVHLVLGVEESRSGTGF